MPSTRLPSSSERHRPGSLSRLWWIAAALALISGLLMLSYPLMPVEERTATYHWSSAEQSRASLVLNPWRPVQLTIDGVCGAENQLSTLDTSGERRSVGEPGNASGLAGSGLTLHQQNNQLNLTSGEYSHTVQLGECQRYTVHLAAEGYSVDVVSAQPHRVADEPVNILPVINGFFAADEMSPVEGRPGWTATVVADTRYASSPTTAKVLVAAAAAILLVAALSVLFLAGRRPRGPDGGGDRGVEDSEAIGGASPPRRVMPRWLDLVWLDLAVPMLLVLGMLIGGTTDDDGFIAQILRTPSMDGYIGNYVRWNNAPEAPFGWFYEVYAWWGQFSHEPVWLRIPPLLLGLLGWLVLRTLLRRLLPGRAAGDVWTQAAVAGSYLSFWLVFCNSLRPEIIYALGTGLVTVLVYDALRRNSPWRLVLGAVVAGLAIGAGPTGLVALGPFLVAAQPLWRWARRSPRPAAIAVSLTALAGLGSVVLLMFDDQTLATVVQATRIRTDFGPVYPIWQDYLRYWRLFQSYSSRQVLIYLAVVALLFLAWRLFWAGRPGLVPWPGRTRGPDGQTWAGLDRDLLVLIVGSGFALVPTMLLSPTKLPHHFGALALLGPVALGACVHLLRRIRPHPVAWPLLVGGGATMAALSLHQNNQWWKLSTLGLVADRNALAVAGVPLFLPAMALTVVGTGWALWLLRRRAAVRPWVLVSKCIAGLLALLGVLQLANFGYAAVSRHGHYTVASANLAAIKGPGCLLERSLMVEQDLPSGVITDNGQPGRDFVVTDQGSGLGVWTGSEARPDLQTGWLELPEQARSGELPLVISATGIDERHRLIVEFDTGESRNIKQGKKTVGSSLLVDTRIQVSQDAPRATKVRLRTESQSEPWATVSDDRGTRTQPLTVGAPRVPKNLVPLTKLIEDHQVAFAWNLAFFAPCADQPVLAQGRAERADFAVSDSQVPGNISYQAKNGGPFAGVLAQSQQYRIPIYAPGDYTESTMNNLDLVGLGKLISEEVGPPQTGTVRRSGWADQPG